MLRLHASRRELLLVLRVAAPRGRELRWVRRELCARGGELRGQRVALVGERREGLVAPSHLGPQLAQLLTSVLPQCRDFLLVTELHHRDGVLRLQPDEFAVGLRILRLQAVSSRRQAAATTVDGLEQRHEIVGGGVVQVGRSRRRGRNRHRCCVDQSSIGEGHGIALVLRHNEELTFFNRATGGTRLVRKKPSRLRRRAAANFKK